MFLDRDGVINALVARDGRMLSPRLLEEFTIIPGVQKAIDCAVQSVDQIIAVLNPENFGIEMDTISDMKNYWNEVKQEIQNYGKD